MGKPVGKLTHSELQKERFEFFYPDQSRISSGNANRKIESHNCGSGRSNLTLDPMQELEMIPDQRGSLCCVLVADTRLCGNSVEKVGFSAHAIRRH